MNKRIGILGGTTLGAAAMYLLDPVAGRRRRAVARDKLVRAANTTGCALDAAGRDLANRVRGIVAEAGCALRNEPVTDEQLTARLRSALGRVVSHPSSIEVSVRDGNVTLRGPVLESEAGHLLRCVARTRGVHEVDNQLEVHETAANVPGLQGGAGRREQRFELMQTNWSPSARLLASVAGGALAAYGFRRRSLAGVVGGGIGLSLLARGLTNVELKRMVGYDSGRRALDVNKAITINAPAGEVFGVWSDFKNFPRFMSHVLEVQDLGGGRSRWKVAGPAGVPVEWTALTTEFIPNRVLAWMSEPGSTVANAGIVRFDAIGDGSRTRVQVRLSYNPPAGAAGHTAAALFGSDPKREIDEDLARMKTFIETGTPPHDAAQKTGPLTPGGQPQPI
jgi:uncharacterized membrane protein